MQNWLRKNKDRLFITWYCLSILTIVVPIIVGILRIIVFHALGFYICPKQLPIILFIGLFSSAISVLVFWIISEHLWNT